MARNAIGIEIVPEYFSMVKEQLEKEELPLFKYYWKMSDQNHQK
nr:hypothetical protein [Caldithrix abyssi]